MEPKLMNGMKMKLMLMVLAAVTLAAFSIVVIQKRRIAARDERNQAVAAAYEAAERQTIDSNQERTPTAEENAILSARIEVHRRTADFLQGIVVLNRGRVERLRGELEAARTPGEAAALQVDYQAALAELEKNTGKMHEHDINRPR
jgi:F0F1-type ATP synthase membrane subunit b/b'